MNKFFVELPLDMQGNRSYTNSVPAVLEVAITEGSLNASIVAPEFHTRFEYIPVDKLNTNWIEVAGPARVITEGEREALIVQQLRRPQRENQMTIFQDYTLEELEAMLKELQAMKVYADEELARVLSPDYDPETSYEGDEEKRSAIELDIQCERNNLAGIEKDIRIVKDRIEGKKRRAS